MRSHSQSWVVLIFVTLLNPLCFSTYFLFWYALTIVLSESLHYAYFILVNPLLNNIYNLQKLLK